MVAKAYVAGTFDTKGEELGYLAECLRRLDVPVCTVDVGTGQDAATGGVPVDIPADQVAAAHPDGAAAVLSLDDRGRAVAAMATAFRHFLQSRSDLAGIVGAGGSGGTALLAPALQALPVAVPKVLVSTVASGNVAPYVGAADIAMMYSVTDVQGLNAISRRVLGNAAHALAGMILHAGSLDAGSDKPALGLTMFGVTTPLVQAVCRELEADYDCLVFHATGTGGQSMEKLVDSGLLHAVLDLTTTEVADRVVGGVFAAHEDRFGAMSRRNVPVVMSVGALDMVNFGAMDTVPVQFADRLLYSHNPQVTLMRTTAEENRRIGRWIGERVNRMPGPVRFLIPEKGVSLLDADGQAFYNPDADQALFESLTQTIEQTDSHRLVRVAAAINDPLFVEQVLGAFREIGS